jgi:hypothetical protein
MRLYALRLELIAVIACEGGAPRAEPSYGPPARGPGLGVGGAVGAGWAAATTWWRTGVTATDSGQVTTVDSVKTPPLGRRPEAVCLVRVWLPHGVHERPSTAAGSEDGVPPALRATGGWRRLIEDDADGPDGSQSGYQRAGVRCTVEQGWDGGDDSDSTYVAEDWYREEITCWAAPASIGHPSG